MIKTPLGKIPKHRLEEFLGVAGMAIKDKRWVFLTEFVTCEKERNDKLKVMRYNIPLRAYNFEYWYLKEGMEAAFQKTTDEHLADKLDYSSYGKLLDEVRKDTNHIQDIDWDDIDAQARLMG